MSIFYNENDPKAAAWLRELIRQGHLDGVVDDRSIVDIDAPDARRVHLFAGIGGWELALRMAGWPDDLEVWTGSCPCQPFSRAGKRRGSDDKRHLWPHMFRLIRQRRPQCIIGEQVASAIGHGWLDGVFADLEAEGYTCGAIVLGAHSVCAPHIRQRVWWVGHTNVQRPQGWAISPRRGDQLHAGPSGLVDWGDTWMPCLDGKMRRLEPGVEPLAHGIPARVVRVRGYGNAIVPQVAAQFVMAVMDELGIGK